MPSFLLSLLVNWKTTLAGIAAIATGIGTIASQVSTGNFDFAMIGGSLAAILAGTGLTVAKDHNVTGGSTVAPVIVTTPTLTLTPTPTKVS